MKADKYNPKATEAYAKSLIDFGMAILKGVYLVILVLPISGIFNIFLKPQNSNERVSIIDSLDFISTQDYWVLLVILSLAIIVGLNSRRNGIRLLHKLENLKPKTKFSKIKIKDPVDQSDYAVEVDITFEDSSKRFCFFATPEMLTKFGDFISGTEIRLHYGKNMIVVSELNKESIYKSINQLDKDGDLFDHTIAI